MEQRELRELLRGVASGEVSPDDAELRLRTEPYSDLGFAKVDHHRGIRQGVSEVIYGAGKTPAQIHGIIASLLDAGQDRVLVTRIGPDEARQLQGMLASGASADSQADACGGSDGGARIDAREGGFACVYPFAYHELPRMAVIGDVPEPDGLGQVVVACGGTSDLYAAEEAAITAEMLGNEVVRLYDVGVAGIHRLLAHAEDLARARVVVAVAGMEGALASVIGGLVSCPVIAVPTSVGYGASFNGLSALLAMLNSCASGVSVVNIDNGFGAGYQASLINHP